MSKQSKGRTGQGKTTFCFEATPLPGVWALIVFSAHLGALWLEPGKRWRKTRNQRRVRTARCQLLSFWLSGFDFVLVLKRACS